MSTKVKCVKRIKIHKNPNTDTKVIISKNVIDNYFIPKTIEIDGDIEIASSIDRNSDGSSTVYIADDAFGKFFASITKESIAAMNEFQADIISGKIKVKPELVELFKAYSYLSDCSYTINE